MVGDAGAELSAVESMVADWEHGGQERLARVKEVTDRVTQLTATARSADGAVSVSVDSRGLPTDIRIEENAKPGSMAELSAQVMHTLRAAQGQLPQLMAQVAQEYGMAGDGVVSHLLEQAESSFPQPPAPGADTARQEDDFDDLSIYRRSDGDGRG
ncbi:YbaB/EbfC family nucleoid-associated protein [Actinokineospora sp. NBRC 105648]|uniref:YbaB/EbfC family nucleoid-associated protein n=1 Tax=Actinokineospora sp. NBRC 105648 TaxID=3032206 RepID=UPI002556A22A|nr:YbaB/EbfC family nucleoid-associated protein [Actinokineospora sp. NBRC 105648]